MKLVDELSEIAEDNVNSARKTYDETQEVVDTFEQLYQGAAQLREIADKLVAGIDYFKIS